MMLWIIFAVMTAAAVSAVLWPLGRKSVAAQGGSERLVYQDQLREVTRDRAAGLIGELEAESARVEISRRLLAAAEAETKEIVRSGTPPASRYRRAAVLATIVIVPAIAIGFYINLGSPDIPAQSAFAGVDRPASEQSIDDLIGRVEAHLTSNPNDGPGWELIAPVYLRLGRFDDAVVAWRKSIVLNGDNPERESSLGEALVAAADGVVTDEAKQTFQHALAGNQSDAKARYFLGLADEQDGNRNGAAAKWRALLDSAPQNAPWANFVRAALARVSDQNVVAGQNDNVQSDVSQKVTGPTAGAQSGVGAGPSAGDVAAAENLDDTQRSAMIHGMVQRLADRLHSNGDDLEGWIRLVRAYVLLGDRDKAKDAASDARRALQDHPDAVKQIDGLVKGLGLEG